MKQTLLIISFILWTVKGFAYCLGYGISIWPSGATIKQNSVFIFNAYGRSQKVIYGLDKKYPIYLKSGDHKVRLTVQQIFRGEFGLTQALLKLEERLEVNKDYQLFIDNLAEKKNRFGEVENELRKYDPITKKEVLVIWTVEEGLDSVAPIWRLKPIEAKKTFVRYGCGPESFVYFKFVVEDQSNYVIKATVSNSRTKRKTECFLAPSDSMIMVGHGMCSGPFLFKHGTNFEVTFDILDYSGNLTRWADEGILFTKPKDEENFEN